MLSPISIHPPQNSYWIIVSDEGPARIPVRHASYPEAENEVLRLTVAHPGINFTVFESIVSFKTPVENTQKTIYNKSWEYSYVYRSQPAGF